VIKVYQLLAHGRWFSPGTPASFTTKTGCHDRAEILLKVALNTIKIMFINMHILSYSVTVRYLYDKFLFFPQRDLNPHLWYIAAPIR
jgi:hypothetical protein